MTTTTDEHPTFNSVAEISAGGRYEERDGVIVRVQAPTAPATPNRAEGPQATALGGASGDPPAAPEAAPTGAA